VVTASEFARTSNGDGTGFLQNPNAGGPGSNHWKWTQPHILFGAGVKAKVLAPFDDDIYPSQNGLIYSTQALLYTLGAAMGLPSGALEKTWPSGTQLHPELAPLFDLWA
jgi:hypothetical protein